MSFIKDIGSGLGTLLFGGLGSLLGGKAKKPVQPRAVMRDEAREQVETSDALRRRKGAAADMITGTRGAEAAASSVGRIVMGS